MTHATSRTRRAPVRKPAATATASRKPTAPARPIDLASESVAGEEDPGAALVMEPVVAPPPGTAKRTV